MRVGHDTAGIDVDDGVSQVWNIVKQLVERCLGDCMALGNGERSTDAQTYLREESVSDPTSLNL
jgi:hypothetical protein